MDTSAGVTQVARIYGQPLGDLPPDLYIPPDALEVFLDSFEGPLDLLLYLIRRANFDVLDIPMARLTEQYLHYVELMRARNLELAADYLLMAATLLQIKSRMLLPTPARAEAEEVADPRTELVKRLLEYERMKRGAQLLDARPWIGRDCEQVGIESLTTSAAREPDVAITDLPVAWLRLAQRRRVRAHHRVFREQLSVREYMARILRCMADRDHVEFVELLGQTTRRAELVVSYLAALELARERMIALAQREPLAPLYLRRTDASLDAQSD